ncbi:hypothetical protein EVAR_10203_1 [Eumeta japonica]|uniref:Uncharacterized protein n=1 Tax=Eumeta variegata TaxID=151549 RepID=A0A4C1TDE9_EUMVA|nr:hypothetical protein EVAR_10203_1 [Eumeta japonica]
MCLFEHAQPWVRGRRVPRRIYGARPHRRRTHAPADPPPTHTTQITDRGPARCTTDTGSIFIILKIITNVYFKPICAPNRSNRRGSLRESACRLSTAAAENVKCEFAFVYKTTYNCAGDGKTKSID